MPPMHLLKPLVVDAGLLPEGLRQNVVWVDRLFWNDRAKVIDVCGEKRGILKLEPLVIRVGTDYLLGGTETDLPNLSRLQPGAQ